MREYVVKTDSDWIVTGMSTPRWKIKRKGRPEYLAYRITDSVRERYWAFY